ncbi:hypothetical protein KR100_01180 [Synechococcus sp. KORDI-100]|nr:hypothetical protein KR100_01180 [Synechococcus sp. KORDI-100]
MDDFLPLLFEINESCFALILFVVRSFFES